MQAQLMHTARCLFVQLCSFCKPSSWEHFSFLVVIFILSFFLIRNTLSNSVRLSIIYLSRSSCLFSSVYLEPGTVETWPSAEREIAAAVEAISGRQWQVSRRAVEIFASSAQLSYWRLRKQPASKWRQQRGVWQASRPAQSIIGVPCALVAASKGNRVWGRTTKVKPREMGRAREREREFWPQIKRKFEKQLEALLQ